MDGVQNINANHVPTTKVKAIVQQVVDGTPPTANASNVHHTQLKPYAQEPLDALGVPMPALLVPAFITRKLANLHSVVGVLECAQIAEVSVTPLHVQRP